MAKFTYSSLGAVGHTTKDFSIMEDNAALVILTSLQAAKNRFSLVKQKLPGRNQGARDRR